MKKYTSINLYDNTSSSFNKLNIDPALISSVYSDISNVADKAIKDFGNKNILLFSSKSDDEIEKLPILRLKGAKTNPTTQEILKSTVETGNLMGFIKIKETQINIKSRFSDKEQDDFFLQYMLSKILHLNIVNFKHTIEKDDFFELYIYLFSALLKHALRKGVFRLYKTFYRNDSSIKGCIDISKFIKIDIPFSGNIATFSRQFCYDNNVTELIRHTIEYISTNSNYSCLLSIDKEIKDNVRIIREITPSYDRKQRISVIKANRKRISHPFFSEYTDLQKLCLLILHKEKVSYSGDKKELNGILFDGAWLWEEYLWTVLKGEGFTHPRNKSGEGGIHIYKGNICYPDFYKGKQPETTDACKEIKEIKDNFILDAKYKRLEENSIQREDLHQLITYMHILPAQTGGLIYPYSPDSHMDENVKCSDSEKLYGFGGSIRTYGIKIPQKADDYNAFKEQMKEIEQDIKNTFVSANQSQQ